MARRDPNLHSQYLCRFCGERIVWGAIVRVLRVDPDTPGYLPGTGRGTIRRMVVGTRRTHGAWTRIPSVSPAGCHLPVPGRISTGTGRARGRCPTTAATSTAGLGITVTVY
jgi:hypothetical protein